MKTHIWKMCGYKDIPDKIDNFAAENLGNEFHNGPKCTLCGYEFCKHCNPEGYDSNCGDKSIGADNSELNNKIISLYNSLKL